VRRHRFHLRRDAGQETARAAQTQRALFAMGIARSPLCEYHRTGAN
jgi:hypothetical protein